MKPLLHGNFVYLLVIIFTLVDFVTGLKTKSA